MTVISGQKQLKAPPDVASTGQQPGDSSVPQEGTCLHGACYLTSREPAAVLSPCRASQYLPSRFKMPFFSSRLQKNKEHFVSTKQALWGIKKIVSPLYPVTADVNISIQVVTPPTSSYLEKLTKMKKNPPTSLNNLSNAPPTPTQKKEASKPNEKVNLNTITK